MKDAPPVAPFDGARPTVRGQPRHEDTNGSAQAPLASPADMPPSLDGIPNIPPATGSRLIGRDRHAYFPWNQKWRLMRIGTSNAARVSRIVVR